MVSGKQAYCYNNTFDAICFYAEFIFFMPVFLIA